MATVVPYVRARCVALAYTSAYAQCKSSVRVRHKCEGINCHQIRSKSDYAPSG